LPPSASKWRPCGISSGTSLASKIRYGDYVA
jgi:hypothetical protein